MSSLSNLGLPPWVVPLAIVHVAMVLVLLIPAMRSFGRSGAGALNALWLVLPGIGLIVVAVLMMLRVMPAAQKPRVLAILVVIPLVNVLFLWLFAYGKWSEGDTPPRKPARERTKPEEGQERALPTLTGAGAAPDRSESPAMVEPTLHAGAAGSGGDGEQTLQGPAAGSDDGDEEAAVSDAGDQQSEHTIVAGPAAAHPAGPKVRTKVAARVEEETGDKSATASASQEQGFDLVGVDEEGPAAQEEQDDDAFDEDGEPIGQAAEAAAASADAEQDQPDLQSLAADVDEERSLRGQGVTEEDVALAQGVVDDLNEGEADPTESPMVTELPLTDVAPDRVWHVRGVNARAANIEASIREEDVSRSVTGILVGRSNRADFIIDDESVSRNHARFVYQDGSLQVEDLDSMNGTWLDGEKLAPNEPEPLRRASDVEFGKIRLEVKEIDPE